MIGQCLLVVLLSLLLAQPAWAQLVGGAALGRSNARATAINQAIVTIGDGINSVGRFNGPDEIPFIAALDAMPAGGTVVVGAGLYAFTSPVTVSNSSIIIRGAGATLLASQDPQVGVFRVEADHVSLEGLQIRQDTPTSSQALVFVTASRFRLRDARFSAGDAPGLTPDFVLIQGQSGNELHDIWVQAVQFQTARGWTAVRCSDIKAFHLLENGLSGTGGSQSIGYMRFGFHFTDVTQGDIRGNIFRSLGDETDLVEAAIFSEAVNSEGQHLVIADNAFHDMVGKRVVHLRASNFNVISNNSFGRLLSGSMVAGIEVESNSLGVSGTATTITGNDFHNSTTAPMIRINGGIGYQISSNQFQIVGANAIVIGNKAPAWNTTIFANQIVGAPSAGGSRAVIIMNGAYHAISGNMVQGFMPFPIAVTGVEAGKFTVANNFIPD